MTFFQCLPIILLAINGMFLAYWISKVSFSKVSSRLTDLGLGIGLYID